MSTALQGAALLVAVLAVLSASTVLLRTRAPAPALGLLLDLLLAAGLLRLADDPDWSQVATAAALVAARGLLAGGPGPGDRLRRATAGRVRPDR